MAGGRLRPDQRRRHERHADAQHQHGCVRALTSATTRSPRQRRWDRSDRMASRRHCRRSTMRICSCKRAARAGDGVLRAERRDAGCKWPDRRHPDQPGESAHRRAGSVVTNFKRGTLRVPRRRADAARIGSCGAAVVTLFLTFCLVFGYISLILLIESRGTLLETIPEAEQERCPGWGS